MKNIAMIVLTIATLCQSAAYAGDPVKGYDVKLGVTISAVYGVESSGDMKKLGTGPIASIDFDRIHASSKHVFARVWVGETETPGWIPMPRKKKSKAKATTSSSGSCCNGTGTSVTIVNNGAAANVEPVRHYVGPVYFSADNRSTVNNNNNITTPPAQERPAARVCPHCAGTPRYSGGLAYCPNGNGIIGTAPRTSHYRYTYRYNNYSNLGGNLWGGNRYSTGFGFSRYGR
jgi:hypothetical protein